jgi:hypothetical protein
VLSRLPLYILRSESPRNIRANAAAPPKRTAKLQVRLRGQLPLKASSLAIGPNSNWAGDFDCARL